MNAQNIMQWNKTPNHLLGVNSGNGPGKRKHRAEKVLTPGECFPRVSGSKLSFLTWNVGLYIWTKYFSLWMILQSQYQPVVENNLKDGVWVCS